MRERKENGQWEWSMFMTGRRESWNVWENDKGKNDRERNGGMETERKWERREEYCQNKVKWKIGK